MKLRNKFTTRYKALIDWYDDCIDRKLAGNFARIIYAWAGERESAQAAAHQSGIGPQKAKQVSRSCEPAL